MKAQHKINRGATLVGFPFPRVHLFVGLETTPAVGVKRRSTTPIKKSTCPEWHLVRRSVSVDRGSTWWTLAVCLKAVRGPSCCGDRGLWHTGRRRRGQGNSNNKIWYFPAQPQGVERLQTDNCLPLEPPRETQGPIRVHPPKLKTHSNHSRFGGRLQNMP